MASEQHVCLPLDTCKELEEQINEFKQTHFVDL